MFLAMEKEGEKNQHSFVHTLTHTQPIVKHTIQLVCTAKLNKNNHNHYNNWLCFVILFLIIFKVADEYGVLVIKLFISVFGTVLQFICRFLVFVL